MRLAILDLVMSEPPDGDPGWSAKTVASALGMSLAAASHRVRSMRGKGLLAQVGEKRQVRGGLVTTGSQPRGGSVAGADKPVAGTSGTLRQPRDGLATWAVSQVTRARECDDACGSHG